MTLKEIDDRQRGRQPLSPAWVEIYRNDTKETIYESKAIPVGSKIEKAALDVHLEAGTYACTAPLPLP